MVRGIKTGKMEEIPVAMIVTTRALAKEANVDVGQHNVKNFSPEVGQIRDPAGEDPAQGVCHPDHRDEEGGVGKREAKTLSHLQV